MQKSLYRAALERRRGKSECEDSGTPGSEVRKPRAHTIDVVSDEQHLRHGFTPARVVPQNKTPTTKQVAPQNKTSTTKQAPQNKTTAPIPITKKRSQTISGQLSSSLGATPMDDKNGSQEFPTRKSSHGSSPCVNLSTSPSKSKGKHSSSPKTTGFLSCSPKSGAHTWEMAFAYGCR